MAPAKKLLDEDEEEFEDDTPEEEMFTCRICKKTVDADEGDDLINVCDNCAAGYDLDKLWDDYDDGKISDAQLKTVDLSKYILKKAHNILLKNNSQLLEILNNYSQLRDKTKFELRFVVLDKKYHRYIIITEGSIFYIVDSNSGKIEERRIHSNDTDNMERLAIAGDYIGICGFDEIELFDRKTITYQRTLDYAGNWTLTSYNNLLIFANYKAYSDDTDEENEIDEIPEIILYDPDKDVVKESIKIPEKYKDYSIDVININYSNSILEIYLSTNSFDEITHKYDQNLHKIQYDLIKKVYIQDEDFGYDEDSNYAFPEEIIEYE